MIKFKQLEFKFFRKFSGALPKLDRWLDGT